MGAKGFLGRDLPPLQRAYLGTGRMTGALRSDSKAGPPQLVNAIRLRLNQGGPKSVVGLSKDCFAIVPEPDRRLDTHAWAKLHPPPNSMSNMAVQTRKRRNRAMRG